MVKSQQPPNAATMPDGVTRGLIFPATPELYHGHPIDPKTEQLMMYVRVELDDIVVMDHEPPVDCDQEELPY